MVGIVDLVVWFESGSPENIIIYKCNNDTGCESDYFMVDITPIYFFIFLGMFMYFTLHFWGKFREIIYRFPDKKNSDGSFKI